MSNKEGPGSLSIAFYVEGNPVWAGLMTPEAARAMADWWQSRAGTEYEEDMGVELRQLARRLREWAEAYGDKEPAFRTRGSVE